MDLMSDWDWSISQEELDAIEATIECVTSSNKRRNICNVDNSSNPKNVRRLPNWGTQPSQSTLNPCGISKPDGENRPVTRSSSTICSSNGSITPSPSNYQLPNFFRPPPANVKVKYPAMKFGGCIVYCRTALEVEKAMKELLGSFEAKLKTVDRVSIGFDIEWRPIFKRGVAPRKAAVMQICGDTSHCYVIHIIHSGIPPILQSFLEDPKYLKVGVCIANDAYKVLSDYNVRVQPLEDLSSLANIKLAMPRKWSLASLTEMLACKELEKPNKIRLGNWEVDVLSKGHLEYATTDAFASWHLYEVLRSFSDASDNQNEEKASC